MPPLGVGFAFRKATPGLSPLAVHPSDMEVTDTAATVSDAVAGVAATLVTTTVWLSTVVAVGLWGLLWGSRAVLALRRGHAAELLVAALLGVAPAVWLGIRLYRRASD